MVPLLYRHCPLSFSKWSFSAFQVQEQEEGLHQVQQEVAG